MLPDFLSIKQIISSTNQGKLSLDIKNEPVMSLIPAYRQHEGDRFTIIREDGSQEVHKPELIKAPLQIDLKDIQARGEIAIIEAVNLTKKELTKSVHNQLFTYIDKVVEEAGTGTYAQSKPFSAELYLESLEKMDFEFDCEGNWIEPTMVGNPIQRDIVERELTRLNTDLRLKKRFNEILKTKRDIWNDREANRKLVD